MHSGPTGETVRENVARLRKGAELSYAELSRELGRRGHPIPPLGLRRIESGERRVDVDDLTALAFALDVNPHALLLPHLRGDDVRREVTGQDFPAMPTDEIWRWAEGDRPFLSLREVHEEFAKGGHEFMRNYIAAFHRRVQPKTVMSHALRAERRRQWVAFTISRLEEELVEDLRQTGEERQDSDFTRMFEDEAEELRALDPEDDEAWALRPFDPAPAHLSEYPGA